MKIWRVFLGLKIISENLSILLDLWGEAILSLQSNWFQLAQKYNKSINKICGIRFNNISWWKYSPDISYIFETSNISLHKYTQKMQHKNVLFIQEFSNWQFKHVQLLSYTVNHVNHEILISWYVGSSTLCFSLLAAKSYQNSAYIWFYWASLIQVTIFHFMTFQY